jgi:hypothetical protein
VGITQRDVPPDVWARLQEVAAQVPAKPKPARWKRSPAVPVVPTFTAPGTWVFPLVTASEANGRDWRARSRRAGAAWRAAREAVRLEQLAPFAEHLRAGKPVSVRIVRLGGYRLDRLVNLPSALKGVEDAFAYLLGIQDSSPLWVPSCDQEPGGAVGVRVELSCV